jgi:thiosulfate/3-mercaptopyruvate sulfurtransferase
VEAWKKVFMTGTDADAFFASTHGSLSCTECHAGDEDATDMADAHTGLVVRPSEGGAAACAGCHADAVANVQTSLHATLRGERNLLAQRAGVDDFDLLPASVIAGYGADCASCHTSCGDCHVSRPMSVGGGFVNSHLFAPPDMTENCTACHGSRLGEEYRGERDGYSADVHFVPGAKRCTDCHGMVELHGDGTEYDHRLEVATMPTCESCHETVAAENVYHTVHWGELQCQVCHSQDYKSCNTCHAGEGLAEPSYLTFKIGKNPVPELRTYDYVALRHVPVAPDTYADWGVAELANFTSEPTWKYSAPHNIQRWTDRTEVGDGESCGASCHGTPDGVDGFFLRQADLDAMSAEEAAANQDLIVPNGSPTEWE